MGERQHCPLVAGDTRSLWSEDTATPHPSQNSPRNRSQQLLTRDQEHGASQESEPFQTWPWGLLKNLGWTAALEEPPESFQEEICLWAQRSARESQRSKTSSVAHRELQWILFWSIFMGTHTRKCLFSFLYTFLISLNDLESYYFKEC